MAFHQKCQQMFSMIMKLLPITNFLFYFQLVMYETAAFHDKLTPLFTFEKSGSGPLIKEICQCIEHSRIPVALHDFHPSCSNTMHYKPEIVGIHLFLSRVAQQLASFIKQAFIVLEYGINPCRLERKDAQADMTSTSTECSVPFNLSKKFHSQGTSQRSLNCTYKH